MYSFRRNRNLLLAAFPTAALIISSGCSPAPAGGPTPTGSEMQGHFEQALELQTGAILDDLDRVRAAGTRLRDALSITLLPPRSEIYERTLRAAASLAAAARDGADARRAAAEVGATCGSCHRASNVRPSLVVGSPPSGTSLSSHMARQERISRLLWVGMIGPSDQDWQDGAHELIDEPPFPSEIIGHVGDAQMLDDARAELQSLGQEAANAREQDRPELVARVWSVCAGCHQAAGTSGY